MTEKIKRHYVTLADRLERHQLKFFLIAASVVALITLVEMP